MWSSVNQVLNALFDIVLWPVQMLAPAWQLALLAIPATLMSLLVFRFASNQDGIRAEKDKIKAYLLELRLFKDDLGVMVRAQRKLLRHTLRYMRHALVPMALMVVPFLLILVQVESRFAFRGLSPGEEAVLTVSLDAGSPVSAMDCELNLPPGLESATPALRIDASGEILWRIRAREGGFHELGITIDKWRLQKTLVVDQHQTHLSPTQYRDDDIRVLGWPAEGPLDSRAAVASVSLDYPRARAEFAGLSSASWSLFLFTLVLGFLLRGAVGVTF